MGDTKQNLWKNILAFYLQYYFPDVAKKVCQREDHLYTSAVKR